VNFTALLAVIYRRKKVPVQNVEELRLRVHRISQNMGSWAKEGRKEGREEIKKESKNIR
jgi:hypothetical protein